AGELGCAVRPHGVQRGGGGARAQGYDRRHLLTPALARRPDDEGIVDGVVALEHPLDLLDEHLLAARVDAHRLAPEEEQAAVGEPAAAVAAYRVAHAVDHREGLARLL